MFRLDGGLTVLHAPNTSGKSTVLHAFLYALGLEQMLSPRREIPLSYAMREYVQNPSDGVEHKILESYVAVEIENTSGQMMTVRRNVIAEGNRRLISVIGGPELTEGPGDYVRRDYFVMDAGGAQRETGFHRLLAEFMNWNLPTVKRFDGGDCPLYVETLFPLFFVEQKVGWTAIPAAIPTQFRIREVHRQSVEFLMDFDTHDLELRRQDLELRVGAARTDWAKSRGCHRCACHGIGVQSRTPANGPGRVGKRCRKRLSGIPAERRMASLADAHRGSGGSA